MTGPLALVTLWGELPPGNRPRGEGRGLLTGATYRVNAMALKGWSHLWHRQQWRSQAVGGSPYGIDMLISLMASPARTKARPVKNGGWIPAFAGMTDKRAGMTERGARALPTCPENRGGGDLALARDGAARIPGKGGNRPRGEGRGLSTGATYRVNAMALKGWSLLWHRQQWRSQAVGAWPYGIEELNSLMESPAWDKGRPVRNGGWIPACAGMTEWGAGPPARAPAYVLCSAGPAMQGSRIAAGAEGARL